MWRCAGVRREGGQLRSAATTLDTWCRYALNRQFSDPAGWELQNMLTMARIMIHAALEREESRGVHHRRDFPQQDNAQWKKRLTTSREAGIP
jgi:L-aspartate oxidase